MDGSGRTREVDIEETAKRAERLTRLSLFLVAGYLFATTVPLIRWSVVNASRGALVVHLLARAGRIFSGSVRKTQAAAAPSARRCTTRAPREADGLLLALPAEEQPGHASAPAALTT